MKPKLRAFKVQPDVNRYQYFLWDYDAAKKWVSHGDVACDGAPKGDDWNPAPVYQT